MVVNAVCARSRAYSGVHDEEGKMGRGGWQRHAVCGAARLHGLRWFQENMRRNP